MTKRVPLFFCSVALASLSVPACSILGKGEAKYPTGLERTDTNGDIYAKPGSIFGSDGVFGVSRTKDNSKGDNGISVNSYLWRAALDTVSFMPLASADPFGGVILTDWYADPAHPDERTKLNVFILGRELKAEGVKVKAFRQVRTNGTWNDAPVAAETSSKLEDAILTRARQMRVNKDSPGLF